MGFRVPISSTRPRPASPTSQNLVDNLSDSQVIATRKKCRRTGNQGIMGKTFAASSVPFHTILEILVYRQGYMGYSFPGNRVKKRDRDPRWTPGDHWTTSLHPCVSSEHHLGADTSELQTTEATGAVWFTSFATACFDIHLKFLFT